MIAQSEVHSLEQKSDVSDLVVCGKRAEVRGVAPSRFQPSDTHRTRTPVNRRLRYADLCTVFCSNDAARALKSHPKVALVLKWAWVSCQLWLTPTRSTGALGMIWSKSIVLYTPSVYYRKPAPVHHQRRPVRLLQVQCSYQTPRL